MSTENQDDTNLLRGKLNSTAHTHMNVICHIQQSAASQWSLANFPYYYIIIIVVVVIIIIIRYIHTYKYYRDNKGTVQYVISCIRSYNYTAQSHPVLFERCLKWQHC